MEPVMQLALKLHSHSGSRRLFSLTPCFSWVCSDGGGPNRFNGFSHIDQTVETVADARSLTHTQPKPKQGVNERERVGRQLRNRVKELAFHPPRVLSSPALINTQLQLGVEGPGAEGTVSTVSGLSATPPSDNSHLRNR